MLFHLKVCILLWCVTGLCLRSAAWGEENKGIKVVCPNPRPAVQDVARSDVYKATPYKAGEEAKYELKYGAIKVLVGYGFLRVRPPLSYELQVGEKAGTPVKSKRWHQVFQAEAYTGDWYKMIFAGHDKIQAFVHPWDFGISKFYMSQNEEKPFVRRYQKEKWLDFNHYNCKVDVREVDHEKKKESQDTYDLYYGAADALGAIYKLRTFDFALNKRERIPVYSSEKNWWLEAIPTQFETVTVNAGTFETVKLSLKTFLGDDLQQKGDVYLWIATKHPDRPLVKVEGEVTFGSIYLLLDSFTSGRS